MGTCAPEINTWKKEQVPVIKPEAGPKKAFPAKKHPCPQAQEVDLDLLLVEHAQPLEARHVGQALPERQAVPADLPVQPVVGHQVDVRDPVGAAHRDILATRFQLNHL